MYVLVITLHMHALIAQGYPETLRLDGYDTQERCERGGIMLTLPPFLTFRCEKHNG
jgi:hypothetical protein